MGEADLHLVVDDLIPVAPISLHGILEQRPELLDIFGVGLGPQVGDNLTLAHHTKIQRTSPHVPVSFVFGCLSNLPVTW